MNETARYQRELDALPALLRGLLDRELAAGNRIVEVGHSHPAAPIGAFFRLERALSTRTRDAQDGIVYRARNSSLYSGEITDADGIFFLLEPPLPPPSEPDMDAIRAAANKPRPRVAPTISAQTPFIVEIDNRGEELTYREADRQASIACSLGRRSSIYSSTLGDWFYPAQKRVLKMSASERREVLARIVACCARDHDIEKLEIED